MPATDQPVVAHPINEGLGSSASQDSASQDPSPSLGSMAPEMNSRTRCTMVITNGGGTMISLVGLAHLYSLNLTPCRIFRVVKPSRDTRRSFNSRSHLNLLIDEQGVEADPITREFHACTRPTPAPLPAGWLP